MNTEGETAESKYEVREVIGKGAFGEVNLVVEKHSKQRYVLKRIKMARQSEWQRKATRQEIEIVSRLRHPFIMPYKEHWTHHGHTINVVYGYCEKGDLTSAIAKQRGKLFSEETLRLWLAELLLAIDYMHRQNVLHRDIKTQNILLTGEGDVQIGDFGLSTVRVPSGDPMQQQQPGGDDTDVRMDSSPAHLDTGLAGAGAATPEHVKAHHNQQHNHGGMDPYATGLANAHANGHGGQVHLADKDKDKDKDQLPGHTPVHDAKAGTRNDYALVGTPHFMSPELLSSQKYSFETDIWSLGVVMYELTTLKPPFNAFNLAGLVAKIKRAALPPIPPGYSADWTALLKSMLRKDPIRRANPLDLLAVPSMQQALQQARQRALAIAPDFVMPEIPIPADGASPGGFCFDLGGGGAAAAAVAQRTPSAGGAATPVLVNPPHAGSEEGFGTTGGDGETSPMSKFPDLGTESPLPALPVPTAAAADGRPAAAPAAATAATTTAPPQAAASSVPAETSRSKTPATSRRPGTTGAAAGGATGAAVAAGTTRRPASPNRARAVPAIATARSKTPARGLPTKAEEAAPPSSRLVRKATLPRDVRSRTPTHANVGMSPREHSTEAAGRPASPSAGMDRHRGGLSSGTTSRVPALGSSLKSGTSSKRSLLDGVGHAPTAAAAASGTAPPIAVTPITVPTPRDTDSDVTTPDGQAAADAAKASTSSSSGGGGGGGGQRSSPLVPAAAGSRAKDTAPWRATRSHSLVTARTTRAALAAAASSPGGANSANGSPTSGGTAPVAAAGIKRAGTAGAGATADSAGTAGVKRPTAAADGILAATTGTKRAGMGAAAAAADGGAHGATSARGRAMASPLRSGTNTIAATTATRRRSQPGTGPPAKEAAAADAAASRQPEKRVRRSSYVSYSKPGAVEAPAQRRAAGGPQAAGVVTAVAVAATSAAKDGVKEGAVELQLSSHPLSASDAALDSYPGSASGGSPDMLPNTASVTDPAESVAVPDAGAKLKAGFAVAASAAAAEAEAQSPAAGQPAVVSSPAAGQAAAPGAAASAPGGHPWRSAPRSRSLLSMTTEDSELSIPDGRYAASDMSNGGVFDNDAAAAAAASPASAKAAAQPLWNSNQLFSGNYGCFGGTLTEPAVPAAATPTMTGPQGRPNQAMPVAGATVIADLPCRVSVSAFAPNMLYGGIGGEGGMLGSETSTAASSPAEPPRGVIGVRRLTVAEASLKAEGADESGRAATPSPGGGFDLLAAGGDSPDTRSSAASQYRRAIAAVQQSQQQLQQRRASGRSAGSAQAQPQPQAVSELSRGSNVSTSQRALTVQPSAAASPGASLAEVISPLRPVAEEHAGEAESAPAAASEGAAAGDGLLRNQQPAASDLSVSERQQLVLLQRVVALASSLWEMGRDVELGSVLSSTLTRPLARRGKEAGGEEEEEEGGQLRQPRVPEPGDAVCVSAGPLRGSEAVVRYRGQCHWGAGVVLGLELPSPLPFSDAAETDAPTGTRDGVKYFRCQKPGSRAAFVSVDHVVLLD